MDPFDFFLNIFKFIMLAILISAVFLELTFYTVLKVMFKMLLVLFI